MKITSLVYNCRIVEVYTMGKLVRVLRNFGIVVSKAIDSVALHETQAKTRTPVLCTTPCILIVTSDCLTEGV